MSTNIEIEAKALVSESEYKVLINLFKEEAKKIYSQTNYYIDSHKRVLKSIGVALRIRQIGCENVLTLKTPLSEGLLEKSQSLTEEQFDDLKAGKTFPKGEINRVLTMLGIEVNDLRIITSLTTDRIDITIKDGTMSLDKNIYSGITDYEVEVEYNSLAQAEEILKDILSKNGIEYIRNFRSKQMRAIEAYIEKNNK